MENPQELYRKSKLERDIFNKMDLSLAKEEIKKIIDLHMVWINIKKPVYNEIQWNEFVVYQELLSESHKLYAQNFAHRNQTEEELEERRIDFNKFINPFVVRFSKMIYSLTK